MHPSSLVYGAVMDASHINLSKQKCNDEDI